MKELEKKAWCPLCEDASEECEQDSHYILWAVTLADVKELLQKKEQENKELRELLESEKEFTEKFTTAIELFRDNSDCYFNEAQDNLDKLIEESNDSHRTQKYLNKEG